jgi:hypothetical protein
VPPLNTSKMTFESIFPVQVEVEIEGRPYLLVECTAKKAARWKDAVAKATKLDDGKVSGIEKMSETDGLLLSFCLFDASKGKAAGERTIVPLTTIEEWPHSITSQLVERVKEISRLQPKLPLKALREMRAKIDEEIKVIVGELEGDSKNLPGTTRNTTDAPPNGELTLAGSSAAER